MSNVKSTTGREFKQTKSRNNQTSDTQFQGRQLSTIEKKRKLYRGRSAIEPIMSYLKKDFRMQILYLKGAAGDMLSGLQLLIILESS